MNTDFLSADALTWNPDRDPHNIGSFWETPGAQYWLIVPAILWVLLIICFAFPMLAWSPIAGAKRLGSWVASVKKDDWFKVALIAAILLAAVIIAASLQFKRGY